MGGNVNFRGAVRSSKLAPRDDLSYRATVPYGGWLFRDNFCSFNQLAKYNARLLS